jgi:hypothetical protein
MMNKFAAYLRCPLRHVTRRAVRERVHEGAPCEPQVPQDCRPPAVSRQAQMPACRVYAQACDLLVLALRHQHAGVHMPDITWDPCVQRQVTLLLLGVLVLALCESARICGSPCRTSHDVRSGTWTYTPRHCVCSSLWSPGLYSVPASPTCTRSHEPTWAPISGNWRE